MECAHRQRTRAARRRAQTACGGYARRHEQQRADVHRHRPHLPTGPALEGDGDTAYADLAVAFLNAWSSTPTALDGDADRFLSAGIYGFQWANAAEIMRGYPAWAAADFAAFQNMMLTIFYPMSHQFWESIYNHYVKRRGLAAPYVAMQVAQLHPETDGGNGDQLGFGTLTFSRDSIVTGNSPSGVTAYLRGAQVLLSWWGVAGATSYNVKRATTASGPFTTIATGISDVLTWTDAGVAPETTYHYAVTAVSGNRESAASDTARVSTAPELLFHLAFDEGRGNTTADATGAWPASTLANGATWTAGQSGSAVVFDGVDNYVALPPGTTAALADFTIAAHVRIDSAGKWAQVFDFGSGERRWMMLTVKDASALPAYAIDTCHGYVTQRTEGSTALPLAQWVRIAVALSGSLCTLYVNGAPVGVNEAMTLAPYHLGTTTSSYLGRSQYVADAFLQGAIDDYRLYAGALTPSQVAGPMSVQGRSGVDHDLGSRK
jgi:hypothetical protein